MDDYFIAKRFVKILLNNLNRHFMHTLNRCMNDIKDDDMNRNFVNYIINELQGFLNTHINDIRFGAIGKYKNDYLSLKDDLMIHTLNHLQNTDFKRNFIDKVLSNVDTVDDNCDQDSMC